MTEKENQQIEEIMKVLNKCCNVYDENGRRLRNKCNSAECEYWSDENYCCCSYGRKEAEALYNADFRKIDEGAVVLTKEEKKKLLHEMYEQGKFDAIAELQMDGNVVLTKEEWEVLHKQFAQAMYQKEVNTRKETAKEIPKTLISLLWEEEKGETITIKDLHSVIRSVAKSLYGVEVDE